MTTQLPGSASGKTLSLSAMKAGLRLIGGADLADAIADLTGLSAKRIRALSRDSNRHLEVEQLEYRDLANTFYTVAEETIGNAFRRAAERDQQAIPIAALTSEEELLDYVKDEALQREVRGWSLDEAAYADRLLREMATLCRKWYLDDGTARAYATATGVGRLLRDSREALSILREASGVPRPPLFDAAVEELEKQLASVGWVWTPARAGQLGSLDGFMTPADDSGALLPLQIPVRLLRSPTLEIKRNQLVGPTVFREDADLLRAHVPNGYFLIYCEGDRTLYFASAENVAERFARSKKRRARLTALRTDVVSGSSLKMIGRAVADARAHLLESLANPDGGERVRLLYRTLSSAHHVLFEFIATLALAKPANLWAIYHDWWPDLVDDNGGPTGHLTELTSAINEYEVGPPTELIQDRGPSLMLALMRSTIDILDELDVIFRIDSIGLSENLGVPGLRSIIAAAIERCYRTFDGVPIPVNTPLEEKPSWIIVDYGHYFMSVALVALVVDRLTLAIRDLLAPPVTGSVALNPRPVWIRHRPRQGA